MQPTPDEVRAQLGRILASETFRGAGRVSRLLEYIVSKTLDGGGDQLKEYVLGTEVFDRQDSYDPRLDSIVRVEARRLRAKLEEYYQGAGANDAVVISVPRGSYIPVFESAAPESSSVAVDPSGTVEEPPARRPWIAFAITAAAIGLVAVAGWRAGPAIVGAPADPPGIRIAVLPFAHFSSEPEVALVAARITDGVTSELAREPRLSVVSRTSAARYKSEDRPIREVATALLADVVMEGSVIVEGGGIHVIARLVDGAVDRKVWVAEYDTAPGQIAELNRRIASEAGAAAVKFSTR